MFVIRYLDKIRGLDPEPADEFSDWEDVVETYGEPEVLVPGTVWLQRDSDPMLLIVLYDFSGESSLSQ